MLIFKNMLPRNEILVCYCWSFRFDFTISVCFNEMYILVIMLKEEKFELWGFEFMIQTKVN